MQRFTTIRNFLSGSLLLPRSTKRLILCLSDMGILAVSFYLALLIRLGLPYLDIAPYWKAFVIGPLIALPVFWRFNLYNFIVRYTEFHFYATIFKALSLSILLLFAAIYLLGDLNIPRSVFFIHFALAFLGIASTRSVIKKLADSFQGCSQGNVTVLYGAGTTGAELCKELNRSPQFKPVAFVDDNKDLHGGIIHGLRVHAPRRLKELVERYDVTCVLLAMPGITRERRREIVNFLSPLGVRIKVYQGLRGIVSPANLANDIKEVDISDIIGRDIVAPDLALVVGAIQGKSIAVTGAGGSIGSELCRQILRHGARRLILFEHSEFALYKIEAELRAKNDQGIEILPVLGTVVDEAVLVHVFRKFKVDCVFHAAAYKHVPMVEYNMVAGVTNNVFGTLHAARAAAVAGVRQFVLISTDKAVRPTNVMGATKRLAELVLQALAETEETCFSMVRFGNVIGSSGSVVPLFRQQLAQGGPLTVTHPDVTRYFMTIPEAVQLVLQAGSMSKGGEVFVLNMGEQVSIYEIAQKMITLSGLSIKNADNPKGDVGIRIIGLRPGEKLHEELFIGDNITGTSHPMIMQSFERRMAWDDLSAALSVLWEACRRYDAAGIDRSLRTLVDGYAHGEKLRDILSAPAGDA